MKNSSFENIKKVLPFVKPYRHILFLDLLAAAFTTSAEIALPMILRHLTNVGTQDINAVTSSLIFKLAGLFVLIKVIEVIAASYMTRMVHIMCAYVETDMRSALCHHLQTMSDTFFNNAKVGQLMSLITNDLFDITEFSHHAPEEYFIGTIKILVSFVILLNINVPLTLFLYAMI